MGNAKEILEQRLAKGEISLEEHAKIVAAMDKPLAQAGKDDFNAQRKDLNLAWMWLAGGIMIFLCVKLAVDKLVASGDPVKWWLVYAVYAACAFLAFCGLGGVLGSKKK